LSDPPYPARISPGLTTVFGGILRYQCTVKIGILLIRIFYQIAVVTVIPDPVSIVVFRVTVR
jgi:hypothetical protein